MLKLVDGAPMINPTDNWADCELARDIAIWRESRHKAKESASFSRNPRPEEHAIQRWFDDGGSSLLEPTLC
jgi:hypothetical protein